MYEKTDNYIRYAAFEPIHSFADSDKRICFVNTHCPWKRGPFLVETLNKLSEAEQLVVCVGDTNYASKKQVSDEEPFLQDVFESDDYGFVIPLGDNNATTWTNVNIRKNVLTAAEIEELEETVGRVHHSVLPTERLKQALELERKQLDAFDVIAVRYNKTFPKGSIESRPVPPMHRKFT